MEQERLALWARRHVVYATDEATNARMEVVPQRSSKADKGCSGPRGEVLLGDAFDLIDKIPAASVDLLITSPPYWGLRVYDEQEHNWTIHEDWKNAGGHLSDPPPYEWYRDHGGALGLEPTPEWYVAHLVEFFSKARATLKPGASMWVNIGDTYFARWASIRPKGRQGLGDTERIRRRTPMGGFRQEKQLLMIPSRFAIAMQNERWIVRNDLIWHKPNVAPRPEKDRLRLAHEHLFHFVLRPKEGRPKYFYDMAHAEEGERDVVTVTVKSGKDGHSATFPTDLVRPRILTTSPVGGMVLDPFCGTGRALQVAIEEGRSAIGFDASEKYFETAARSVETAIQGSSGATSE
jgi:site-specific DNA-methyltransferase (cytosine-N4-specific)